MTSFDWQSKFWSIGLDDAPEVVAMGRNAHGFELEDKYQLPDLWSLHLYGYRAELKLDDLELPIRPGFLGITPPNTEMRYRYEGISVHLYVHFRLPESKLQKPHQVRAMQDLESDYELVYEQLFSVMGKLSNEPGRVNARVWDLLWNVVSRSSDQSDLNSIHPAVQLALDFIDQNLRHPLRVSEIAETAHVTPAYLSRLFQQTFGKSVVGTIRQRRVERAKYLLQRSTLPIKAVAADVGMPDLQHFNKCLRTELGVGPREVRRSF